jgi:hypothetical protein
VFFAILKSKVQIWFRIPQNPTFTTTRNFIASNLTINQLQLLVHYFQYVSKFFQFHLPTALLSNLSSPTIISKFQLSFTIVQLKGCPPVISAFPLDPLFHSQFFLGSVRSSSQALCTSFLAGPLAVNFRFHQVSSILILGILISAVKFLILIFGPSFLALSQI